MNDFLHFYTRTDHTKQKDIDDHTKGKRHHGHHLSPERKQQMVLMMLLSKLSFALMKAFIFFFLLIWEDVSPDRLFAAAVLPDAWLLSSFLNAPVVLLKLQLQTGEMCSRAISYTLAIKIRRAELHLNYQTFRSWRNKKNAYWQIFLIKEGSFNLTKHTLFELIFLMVSTQKALEL